MAEKEKDQKDQDIKNDDALVKEAQEACGVPKKYLFASKMSPEGRVTLVTVGGHKISYRRGEKVTPLPEYKVTGIGGPPPEETKTAKKE